MGGRGPLSWALGKDACYNQDLWPPGQTPVTFLAHFVFSGVKIFPAPLIISSAFVGLIHPATAHEICEFGALFSTNTIIRTCQCMWPGGDSLANMKERNLGFKRDSCACHPGCLLPVPVALWGTLHSGAQAAGLPGWGHHHQHCQHHGEGREGPSWEIKCSHEEVTRGSCSQLVVKMVPSLSNNT